MVVEVELSALCDVVLLDVVVSDVTVLLVLFVMTSDVSVGLVLLAVLFIVVGVVVLSSTTVEDPVAKEKRKHLRRTLTSLL